MPTQCRSGFTEKIITEANNLGVKYITVYAFSTENWKRPKEEVDYLMSLLLDYLRNAEKRFRERMLLFVQSAQEKVFQKKFAGRL